MNTNRLTHFVCWPFLVFMMTATPTKHMGTDSLMIISGGTENSVIIDSSNIPSHPAATVISKKIKGSIAQTGRQNKVEINSSEDTVSGKTKSTITIKQTGNNNSVKINSK